MREVRRTTSVGGISIVSRCIEMLQILECQCCDKQLSIIYIFISLSRVSSTTVVKYQVKIQPELKLREESSWNYHYFDIFL